MLSVRSSRRREVLLRPEGRQMSFRTPPTLSAPVLRIGPHYVPPLPQTPGSRRSTNETRRSVDVPTHAPDLVGPCVAVRAALRSAPPANPGVPALLLKKLTAASAPLRPPREIES